MERGSPGDEQAMDSARTVEAEAVEVAADYPAANEPRMEPPPAIGTDERRMHVRAYKFWVSLLHGRPFPSIDSFDPARVPDFGPHGVLLDFSDGAGDPAIVHLGAALRTEGGIDRPIARVSDVPGRSLLSRLTDHYLQIIANRSPIGFEAEFVNVRGNDTLYRGILMPFSSDGETIDHVYGVINWKELADRGTATILAIEVGDALRGATPRGVPGPLWADGPGATLPTAGALDAAPRPLRRTIEGLGEAAAPGAADPVLADSLAAARSTAEQLYAADLRRRAALYRTLGIAYDFACAADADPVQFRAVLRAAGMRRRSMSAVVRLVFGETIGRMEAAELALVLSHAWRMAVEPGGLRRLLEQSDDGIAGIVAAERAARRAER